MSDEKPRNSSQEPEPDPEPTTNAGKMYRAWKEGGKEGIKKRLEELEREKGGVSSNETPESRETPES